MDLGVSGNKIGPRVEKIISRSYVEADNRRHKYVESEHIVMIFAQMEWELFSGAMRELGVDSDLVVTRIEKSLDSIGGFKRNQETTEIHEEVKLILNLAHHHASKSGRQQIEPLDLLAGLLEGGQGELVNILKNLEIPRSRIENTLKTFNRNYRLDEELLKRFELPPFLKHFADSLNLLVYKGKINKVFNRDREIAQTIEILCHKERPNSVLLIGDPGVGKTSIAEGLAVKIEREPESVPLRFRGCHIVNLRMNMLVAGTMLRGMFEDRIQNVIRELRENHDIIPFIDEFHTIIGSGSALGAPTDAAEILKSYLARGEVRIIGATTLGEYKEYIAENEALSRRFRVVHVNEPTLEEARKILFSIKFDIEIKYRVKIHDEAIETALRLSPRYARSLRLPDKVISWIDTASVRAEIDGTREVRSDDIVKVISDYSKIPINMVFREVSDQFSLMEESLKKRVVGQYEAIRSVVDVLTLNKGPLKDGLDRPDGVLLFLGPTGVGKTELAKALAEFLFGDDKKMIRIDLSEYQDGHVGVEKLIGMPRGVVDSGRGGILTNQLKDDPYSVVLLDEIEKANSNIHNLFLQGFDEGWITDGRGKRVYLSDAVVIMTSNIGSEHFSRLTSPLGFKNEQTNILSIQGDVIKELRKCFSPEFINRIDAVVVFQPLTREEIKIIAEKYIDQIRQVLGEKDKVLIIDPEVLDRIAEDGYSLAYGARFLKRYIDNKLKIPISKKISEAKVFHILIKEEKIHVEASGISIRSENPLAII